MPASSAVTALLLLYSTLAKRCEVPALISSGWLCGRLLSTENGNQFASFRGVPYAKQPIGILRFKELVPHDYWHDTYDASIEGPICPQAEQFYDFVTPMGMNEACIYANVHVPIEAMPIVPRYGNFSMPPSRPETTMFNLPILVFIHGGGFSYGSGDAYMFGPEILIDKQVIVITFNYRLNVFGFLSLNTTNVPGNAGLRDAVTLLRWVRQNAQAFGGDPDNVTLGGHSAGAAMAHILTLSSAAIGLFKRAILMSGSAIRSFYSMAPGYADTVRTTFLAHLGVTATDPEEIFHRLVKTSIEDIIEANREVQDLFGTLSFTPVVESKQVGVTRILDDDPEILSYEGRGRDIALMIGFTTDECELFRHRLEELQALESVHNHPVLVTPPSLAFTRPPEVLNMIVQKIKKEYLKEMSMNNYVKLCSDMSFEYPALKSAEIRAQAGGQNVYLYQFSYESDLSYIKRLKDLHYKGVGHLEDLTYLFNATGGECAGCGHKPKFVSIEEVLRDELMKDWMGTLVSNFVKYSTPVKDPQFWPSVSTHNYQYQDIKVPKKYHVSQLTQRQFHLMQFHDSLHNIR